MVKEGAIPKLIEEENRLKEDLKSEQDSLSRLENESLGKNNEKLLEKIEQTKFIIEMNENLVLLTQKIKSLEKARDQLYSQLEKLVGAEQKNEIEIIEKQIKTNEAVIDYLKDSNPRGGKRKILNEERKPYSEIWKEINEKIDKIKNTKD